MTLHLQDFPTVISVFQMMLTRSLADNQQLITWICVPGGPVSTKSLVLPSDESASHICQQCHRVDHRRSYALSRTICLLLTVFPCTASTVFAVQCWQCSTGSAVLAVQCLQCSVSSACSHSTPVAFCSHSLISSSFFGCTASSAIDCGALSSTHSGLSGCLCACIKQQ